MTIRTLQQVKADLISQAPVECDFQLHEKVMFINEQGQAFGPYEIIGFGKEADQSGRFIFLNKESYWVPVAPKNLRKA